ncbi:hypothetical protein HDU67_010417 [Dinochytrium kinnereticum]|nr:hypothetical protein HDU67_010417 [Dinochytrium kinnereticum]
MQVILQSIPFRDVEENAANFNSNNHLYEDVQRDLGDSIDLSLFETPIQNSDEYFARMSATRVGNWIKLLPFCDRIFSTQLSRQECAFIVQAAKVGSITGQRPKLFDDELAPLEKRLAGLITSHCIDGQAPPLYFVRTDGVSLKDGLRGPGPFQNAQEIVDAMTTSRRCGVDLEKYLPRSRTKDGRANTVQLPNLYFYPWIPELDTSDEWRVFVFRRKVTAVSQYSWAKPCSYKDKDLLRQLAVDLSSFHESLVKEAEFKGVKLPESYVMDTTAFLCAEQTWSISLIELNSFGCQCAAGSGLFHWVRDFEILYGNTLESAVYLRTLGESCE